LLLFWKTVLLLLLLLRPSGVCALREQVSVPNKGSYSSEGSDSSENRSILVRGYNLFLLMFKVVVSGWRKEGFFESSGNGCLEIAGWWWWFFLTLNVFAVAFLSEERVRVISSRECEAKLQKP
jgi:hypothetical protein